MESPATREEPQEPLPAALRVPSEIWIQVFHALDLDYPALWAVYATCMQFHRCVQPALFYKLSVHLVENTVTELKAFDRRIAYHKLWVNFTHVRVLEIYDNYTHFDCMTRVTRSLSSLFERVPRVKYIKWKSRLQISDGILDMISGLHRPVVVDIQGAHEIFLYNSSIRSTMAFYPLMQIRSLDINLEHWDQVDHELKQSLFPICSMHTLEALTLTYRAIAPNFKVCNVIIPIGAKMARLKTLRLYNVCFVGFGGSDWTKSIAGYDLQHLTLDGYFATMEPLKQLAGLVPNLKSLSLRLRNEQDQINEPVTFDMMAEFLDTAAPAISDKLECFLRGVNALEEFSGYDLPLPALNEVVMLQGNTLQTLRFRDTVYRANDRGQGVYFIGCKQLNWMIGELPALKRLGITMVLDGETPQGKKIQYPDYKMLSYIARIPCLTHLEINTPPNPDPDALAAQAAATTTNTNGAPPPTAVDIASSDHDMPISEQLVEEIFSYVAHRKDFYSGVVANYSWPSFNGLDMIAREWEPMMEGMRSAFWGLRSTYIYTCRRRFGVPDGVQTSVVSGCGLSLMCVHRYNQTLTASGVWDRRGVYAFEDTNGLEFMDE